MSECFTARPPSRRLVLQMGAASCAGGLLSPARAAAATPRGIKLGFDNFAVRAFGHKADALIDYAAALRVDSLFITDLDAFTSFETPYLRGLAETAAAKGVQIHLGTWSICPTSNTFKDTWGNADAHLALGLRVARDLGSPVLRVILGNANDRTSKGGIAARIADTVAVLRRARGKARKAGVKIAVENHAGDMRAVELRSLVEKAGKDFVGVNIDPGNAVWALEDPVENLEILGPHVLTSSMRDSLIWESEKGATVQWCAMGDGVVDFARYMDRFAQLCPGVPVHIETISGFNRELPFLDPAFLQAYPGMSAADLAAFIRLARKGKPTDPWKAPAGVEAKEAERAHQKAQLERSLTHCRTRLGLGVASA